MPQHRATAAADSRMGSAAGGLDGSGFDIGGLRSGISRRRHEQLPSHLNCQGADHAAQRYPSLGWVGTAGQWRE